jgi:hypothetical protein
MYQAAREEGYDVKNENDLLDKLDDEIRKGKATYKTHGYLDYRNNPKKRVMKTRAKLTDAQIKKTAENLAKMFPGQTAAQVVKKLKKNPRARSSANQQSLDFAIKGYLPAIKIDERDLSKPKYKNLKLDKTSEEESEFETYFRDPLTGYRYFVRRNPAKVSKINNFYQILLPNRTYLKDAGGRIWKSRSLKQAREVAAKTKIEGSFELDWLESLNKPLKVAGKKYYKVRVTTKDAADNLYLTQASIEKILKSMQNPNSKYLLLVIYDDNNKKIASYSVGHKKNPSLSPLLGMFANSAVGLASALQIKDRLSKKKTARKPKTAIKHLENPNKPTLKLRIGHYGSNLISTPLVLKGQGISLFNDGKDNVKGNKTYRVTDRALLKLEKSYNVVYENPKTTKKTAKKTTQNKNPYVDKFLLSALNKIYKAKNKKLPINKLTQREIWTIYDESKQYAKLDGETAVLTSAGQKLIESQLKQKTAKTNPVKAAKPVKKTNPKVRKTYEMFQGRPSTEAKPMPVSNHAPKSLDQLGDLVEIKLQNGETLKFDRQRNGKTVYPYKLCSNPRGTRLWIAGGKIANRNPSLNSEQIELIEPIEHIVYGSYKPHIDETYCHYIHALGEDTGEKPYLGVDKEGYPVIHGGNYTIEDRGIVN